MIVLPIFADVSNLQLGQIEKATKLFVSS